MDKKWEIGLKKILVGDTFSRVNRGQRVSHWIGWCWLWQMIVDTGSASHYLPSVTTGILFHENDLSKRYMQVHFVADQNTAVETTEAAYQLIDPSIPAPEIRLLFQGPEVEWPLSLASPTGDEYASVRSAATGQPAILGMSFLSQRQAVILDFTPGKERIGFVGGERVESEGEKIGTRPRERLVQFIVGASLGLGLSIGWKWYEGSLF
jgi:hypothetical protein